MTGTATATQRAAAFVRLHGDLLASQRADAIERGEGAAAALRALEGEDLADPDALERVLALCDELRALRSPPARRAFDALARDQAPDGAFAAADRPHAERLRRTGALGGILARSPYGRPESLDAAGDFLARHFTPDLLQGFQWENVAAYTGFFANALHDAADEVLQWCGRELERGFRARAFGALATARVFVLCDAHGVPGASLSREDLLLGLIGEQAPDGSYGTAPLPADRIEPTLQGLRALAFLDPAGALDSGRPSR